MTSSPEINTTLASDIPIVQPIDGEIFNPERRHMSGDSVPACLLNKFGRFLHRLSTLSDGRSSPEEYYADQPETVIKGLRRACSNRNADSGDSVSLSEGISDFKANFVSNFRAIFKKSAGKTTPTEEIL